MVGMDKLHFCVVRFLHKPHPDIAYNVIVPDSWIKFRGDRISVLYPDRSRWLNIEECYAVDPSQSNWTEYLSEMKYTAKNYEDAKKYVETNNGQNKTPSKSEEIRPPGDKNRKRRLDKPVDCPSAPEPARKPRDSNDIGVLLKTMAGLFGIQGKPFTEYSPAIQSTLSTLELIEKSDCISARANQAKSPKINVSFKLPPEYDEKDSRWTLQHREPEPGLQKLVEPYEVYVEENKMRDIFKFSKKGVQLGRLLLPHIFTEIALANCSLSGTSANGRNSGNRPALDQDGTNALLTSIRVWEAIKGWKPEDEKTLLIGLRNKIVKIRNTKANT